ncbi:hypothetical protein KGV55_02615 [Candidatus Gracilibacteria bacterium]|nr:hypothetical protein [Candidatus Gracilibacteria bacterium]
MKIKLYKVKIGKKYYFQVDIGFNVKRNIATLDQTLVYIKGIVKDERKVKLHFPAKTKVLLHDTEEIHKKIVQIPLSQKEIREFLSFFPEK